MATINNSLSTHDWLQLSPQVRAKLIEIFQIPRSGVGHVNYTGKGAEITSDGHTHEDLKAISIAGMQKYLVSSETDFAKLFDGVLTWQVKDIKQDIEVGVQQTQDQMLQSWIDRIKMIRLEAEEKGLISEYIKMLKTEVKIKK